MELNELMSSFVGLCSQQDLMFGIFLLTPTLRLKLLPCHFAAVCNIHSLPRSWVGPTEYANQSNPFQKSSPEVSPLYHRTHSQGGWPLHWILGRNL